MQKQKIILHIPHSSVKIPNNDGFIIRREELEKEILKLTDWFTDDLFYSEEDDMIISDFSRIFCDPERFPDDSLEVMAQFGMGVLYEKSDEGKIIRNVSPKLKERVLNEYYYKHHRKLNEAVNSQLKQFNQALIIDCHSFPNVPLQRSLDKNPDRPDFNIGTDSFHTPIRLIEISIAFFKKEGYSLGIDWPYKGSIVPLEHYNKNKNVQSIMLEINRKLYLNEPSNEKSEGYTNVKALVNRFINELRRNLII
jgi:N-formylglutamate amidohydrolase